MARTIRNYELVRELGSGHFGTVYAAVGEVPGRGLSAGKRRLVGIKKLNEHATGNDRNLLIQEFQLLDEVKHRGIVRVFEYLQTEDAVVMEYVHGVTLRTLLDECRKAREQVFTEAAVELLCELADALYQAFTTPSDNGEPLNLVHRDLKPENIMVTPTGEVKILDFGLARVDNTEYRRERSGRVKGTPIYMAPEQARGEEVSHHSDLFSLGLIAYEIFLNQPAYTVPENSIDPLAEVFDAIESGSLLAQRRELETKLPGVGPIVAKLLQPNAAQRYRTGQDLLVDLRRQLYRDRGSYLEEFCEFFFGSIYDLPEPPAVDIDPRQASASSLDNSGGRLSMADRLKASMAREAKAREVAREEPSWKQERPDPNNRAEPTNRRTARRAKGGTPPPRTPQDTPVPAPPPPTSNRPKAAPPDGMLEMVSLSNDFDLGDDEDGKVSSATAFFAIPAPKDKSPSSSPPLPPPGPATPPLAAGPVAAGPVAAGPVAAGPVAAGPIAQGPIVQGPIAGSGPAGQVASYSTGAAATPFQVSGEKPPPPADHGARTQSNRVYAILLVMLSFVGVVVFLVVWFRPGGFGDEDSLADQDNVVEESVGKNPSERPAGDGSAGPGTGKNGGRTDTGSYEDNPEPPPKVKPPRNVAGGQGGTPTKPKAPKVGSGTINFAVTGGSATMVEVTCPSGYRKRANLNAGSASLTGLPRGEQCTAHFKGGAPASFNPVTGGQSLRCALTDTTANCK